MKTLGLYVEHEQAKEILTCYDPCPVLPWFGMEIPEGNHAVFALEDIIFPDNTPVQVFAEIDDYLVAVAHFFAINNALAGVVVRGP